VIRHCTYLAVLAGCLLGASWLELWPGTGVAYAIVLACQLLANGVLTGRGVVRYDERAIVGWRLVHAPVEDLLFGFALVLLTQATWVWLGRRQAHRPRPDRAGGSGRTGRPGWPACRQPPR
jgi:lycopene cyclase domain-containing protein